MAEVISTVSFFCLFLFERSHLIYASIKAREKINVAFNFFFISRDANVVSVLFFVF